MEASSVGQVGKLIVNQMLDDDHELKMRGDGKGGVSRKYPKTKRRGVFIANPVDCKGIRNEPKPVSKSAQRKLEKALDNKEEFKKAFDRVGRKMRQIERRNASIVSALKPAIRRKNRKAKKQ